MSQLVAPPDLFIFNPENTPFVNRRLNWWWIVWIFLAVGVGLIVLFRLRPGILTEVQLSQMPQLTITGEVDDKFTRMRGSGPNRYAEDNIIYLFSVNDQTYTGRARVNRTEYSRLQIGSPVTVTYAVNDPSISRLGGPEFDVSGVIGTLLISAFLSIGLWVMSAGSTISAWLRRFRFLRNGSLIFGAILHVSGVETIPWYKRFRFSPSKNYHVTIQYEFRLPEGRSFSNEATNIRNDLLGKALPETGTPIAVLYNNENDYMLL